MPCPCDVASLWHACALSWVCVKNHKKIYKKNHIEKNCCNTQCFQEKNCKAKFSTSLILKKLKSTKIILEKNHNKKNKRKKKPCRETQSIVYHEEIYSCNSQLVQY